MTRLEFVRRSLTYYWRGNLAVVAGVATAVAVLAGALLVGASVRGTLRDLALSRLGATDAVVASAGFFREQLSAELAADAEFGASFERVAPLIVMEGFVTAQGNGRRAGRVRVYGVDERFWQFHGQPRREALGDREALVSRALADELGTDRGAPLLIRLQVPSDVPLESLHGRKDDPGRSVRVSVQAVLQADELGEFSLSPEQGRIRAVFVPVGRLQRDLELAGRVNTLLVATRAGPAAGAERLVPILRRVATLADAGLSVSPVSVDGVVSVGADAGILDASRAAMVTRAAGAAGFSVDPIFTYLANAIRIGDREVPYSLVTARTLQTWAPATSGLDVPLPAHPDAPGPIFLNAWAANELGARVGDRVGLDYYVWEEPGRLVTRTADFTLAGIVPIAVADRDLAPSYPGITDSPTLDEWDPPFPLDLSRVRPADEAYWRAFRTTPKAFINLEDGQRIWGSRYGAVTSIRARAIPARPATGDFASEVARLSAAIDAELSPDEAGLIVRDVRGDALGASAGVTDFGEYFVYFSFFLVVSALVLAALFFKLGVEQRVREVGLLGAIGAAPGVTRALFMSEAAVLSLVGGGLGAVGAVGYAALIIHLLGTRWVDAVGTTALVLHVSPAALAVGVGGGVVASLACTWLALRMLGRVSERALLSGDLERDRLVMAERGERVMPWGRIAVGGVAVSAGLVAAGIAGGIPQAGAFFGAGFVMLIAGLSCAVAWYRRPATTPIVGRGALALIRLGLRNAALRPARSALSIAVIAAATFILIAVDAFRKDGISETGPTSGLGGHGLVIESLLPIVHDPRSPDGRAALGLVGLDDVRFAPFRLRPGDDTSCLNLYQPTNPRILGVPPAFIAAGRFSFRASMADTDAERRNPWLLLERRFEDGAIPVIADANSLAYVLHSAVGHDIMLPAGDGSIRLRVVASLADSLFQRELLMAESDFVRVFPRYEGYRFLLAEMPEGRTTAVGAAIEDQLSIFGVDATPSADRLAEFHRVENTYLATFQTLGGLGLLLGTCGLATVLLRNVLERRRELALLGAVGYEPRHLRLMLLAESVSVLAVGLAIGAAAASVATIPALLERGGRVPVSTTGLILVAMVLVAGTFVTVLAARLATRQPLLEALRSE
jgi:ABC-type lipoprotein release transport system permease subunit